MNAINKIFPEVISMMIYKSLTKSYMYDVLKQLNDIRDESFNNTGEDNIYEYITIYPNNKLNLNDHKEPRDNYGQFIDHDSDYDSDSD